MCVCRRQAPDGRKRRDVDDLRTRYAKLLRTVLDEAEAGAPPSLLAPEIVYQVTRGDRTQERARADMADVLVNLLREPSLSVSERLFIVRRFKLESPMEAVD